MNLKTSDFDYELPENLVATRPPELRNQSRMLVLHRAEGRWEHRAFCDFEDYIRSGDLAVLNDTRVIPARVFSDDARVELLLLESESPRLWRCLGRPGKRLRMGAEFQVGGIRAAVRQVFDDGDRLVEFESEPDLNRVGELPLPPYMRREAGLEDSDRYQTVYARADGSVAAPTAGLHFTKELLGRVPHAFVTLHVGSGTFRPVQSETLQEHPMHSERFSLSGETASKINGASRVVAVGTTSARVLESCAREGAVLGAAEGRTSLFIFPPYKFQCVDVLLTNFHLPRSTLLMLVSAFAGRELVMEAYAEAVREQYRFYSYGDCMLIV
jgi:S-adenosylmethionine:tRNA ribosyltransferase-isomerase